MFGERLYNPRSVVGALSFNQLGNYWTSSGPYDEIHSAMVVYGFLTYHEGRVSIPNKELTDKFKIAYDKNITNKKHSCKVELLREKL